MRVNGLPPKEQPFVGYSVAVFLRVDRFVVVVVTATGSTLGVAAFAAPLELQPLLGTSTEKG